MADTTFAFFIRGNNNEILDSLYISVDGPMDYVSRRQMRGDGETLILWDSVAMGAIGCDMADCLVAPVGCSALVDVEGTTIGIPHGRVIYVIVGGNPDASCTIADSVERGHVVDVVARGVIQQGG